MRRGDDSYILKLWIISAVNTVREQHSGKSREPFLCGHFFPMANLGFQNDFATAIT